VYDCCGTLEYYIEDGWALYDSRKGFVRVYAKNPQCEIITAVLMDFKFCPFCGKKITTEVSE